MVALAMLCACKREEATTWVTGIKAPLAKGSLSISDLLPEEYLYADADQRWHFRIEKNLTDFQIDSLVEIPDTTIHKAFLNSLVCLYTKNGRLRFIFILCVCI